MFGFILLFGGAAYARTYKIAMLNRAAWSPVNVAEAKGFWKDQGLDVKVIVCANPLQLFTLFKENRIDIAFDMLGNSIGYYMNGLPVRIIAETDWSYGSDKIVVKKDIDPAVLKSKPVGVHANTPAIFWGSCEHAGDIVFSESLFIRHGAENFGYSGCGNGS